MHMVEGIEKIGSEVLRQTADPVKEVDGDISFHLYLKMSLAMYKYGGIGLAAPQVGVSKRVIVIDRRKSRNDKHQQEGERRGGDHQRHQGIQDDLTQSGLHLLAGKIALIDKQLIRLAERPGLSGESQRKHCAVGQHLGRLFECIDQGCAIGQPPCKLP